MGFLMSFIFGCIYIIFFYLFIFVVVVFWDLINFFLLNLGVFFFKKKKIKPSNGNSYVHNLSFSFFPYLLLATKWITGPYLFQ
jgi:hypothetical protein